MTTAADLIAETKGYLLAGHREAMNTLAADASNITQTLNFSYDLQQIRAGAYVSVDLEIMYVWEVNESAKTAVVQRAMEGSTATAHTSGALVTVNPKFPDFRVLRAINNDILDLNGRGLFQVRKATLTFIAGKYGYDLTGATTVLQGIEARYDPPGPERNWPLLHKWKIRRSSDTVDFPTGFQFLVQEEAHPGRDMQVIYSAPYTTLVNTFDNVETVTGLQSQAHDIPALGAAFRLEAVREPQRNFNEAQPSPRRSTEVAAGAQITSTRGLATLRESRIRSMMGILNKQYPNRRQVR